MTVNYADKYSSVVDEAFKLASITDQAVNKNYDWDGVSTINVYANTTAAMGDYSMSGTSRYGTPAELGNTKQTMLLSKDRAFTFTIDRRNYTDTMMTLESGKALKNQIDLVVTPEIDTYRLSKMVSDAGTTSTAANIDKTNAYSAFLAGITTLLDNKVPTVGRIAYVSSNFYSAIRQDPAFIKSGDLTQDMLVKGQVGEVEGVKLIHVPTSYLPDKVEFIITHPMATVSAEKIVDYKTHDNPPGINGWLVEGRIYYDAFVLKNKEKAIYVHMAE